MVTEFSEDFNLRYDLAFLNISAPTYEHDKRFCNILKKNNPGCIVCAIGVLATSLPNVVLEDFDFCILGEPEETAGEIAARFTGEKKIEAIDGTAYYDKKGALVIKERKLNKDLDKLPFPNRDRMENKRYIEPLSGKPFTVIKIERGCPYNCSFCTATYYYGHKPRYRSAKSVIEEITLCVNKYGIGNFLFLADTFTINPDYVEDLCKQMISLNLDVNWFCNSRLDTFSYGLGKLMKEAGCRFISFGVESASRRIQKINLKNVDPFSAIEVAKICRSLGIISMMYYILGFPTETKEEMGETIALSYNVKSDFARFFVATPLPGSKLYDDLPKKPSLSGLNLADISVNVSNVDSRKMRGMIRYAYFRFYCRPMQMLRLIGLFGNFGRLLSQIRIYLDAYK
jgi:radical SAM superfamily enzyme YgiQ (UPF0313 family)